MEILMCSLCHRNAVVEGDRCERCHAGRRAGDLREDVEFLLPAPHDLFDLWRDIGGEGG
jgi:hypothetical protein